MYPLLDYRNRDPLSGIGGTPRRTIQIEKDGEIIDMDWDSPTPPTQTDVMRWVNRNKPAPIQVDIQRGMSGMGAKDIDTGLIPKPRPPAPPPAPTGPRFNIERGRTADAARQIDT